MNWDEYRCIAFERRSRVLVIKLNRPGQTKEKRRMSGIEVEYATA